MAGNVPLKPCETITHEKRAISRVRIASNAALTLYDEPIYMEFLGEFLERRALSSAACFVTYRRLPAYKKPNGGRSDPPPYNPRVSPVLVLHPQRYSALSTALSHPVSSAFSWNRGLEKGGGEGGKGKVMLGCRRGGRRER